MSKNLDEEIRNLPPVLFKGYDKEIRQIPITLDTRNAIKRLIVQEKIKELNLAIHQYILTTKQNPENFSEYATHRLKELEKELEQ